MAYGFRDLGTTNETAMDGLPSEAMTFNGVTIEKVIPEYQTLQVTGRELMGQTLDTLKVGQQDGERIQGHSIPPREITIKYQINADSPERFRAIFYELNQILSGTDNKFYFADDPEKYFVGTLEEASVPDGGKLQVVSDFTILCNDPYAYAMQEDEFTYSDDVETLNLTIDFKGKIRGDLNSNPNIAKSIQSRYLESLTVDPGVYTNDWLQREYDKLQAQDGVCGTFWNGDENSLSNSFFGFDILTSIERAYPGFWTKYGLIDKNSQIDWLEDNLKSFEWDVWSYCSGVGGNGALVQYYNGTEWVGAQSNTAAAPVLNKYTFATMQEAVANIMPSGFFYGNVESTKPSDGTTGSTVFVDYTCLKLSIELPVTDSLTVNNDGTAPVPIRFEVVNQGENGYLGITNDKENILIGNPEQTDGSEITKSERLFTTIQNNANGLKQWDLNSGVVSGAGMQAPKFQSGNFEDPAVIQEKRWRLRNAQPDNETAWGAGDPDNKWSWHGPSASTTFPPDSQNAIGAVNFTSRFYVQSLFGNIAQSGIFECTIWNPDKKLIVSVQGWKDYSRHNTFRVMIGDKMIWEDKFNPRWDNFFGSIVINRFGNTFTIQLENVEGSGPKTKQTITYDDPDTATLKAAGATYWKGRWGNLANVNQVCYNDLYDFWFTKENVDSYVNSPNTFNTNDKLEITGDDGAVVTTLNGTRNLNIQDIGSRPIMAYPGPNIVSFLYSDFASRPDVKAYIRRKYL